MVMMVFGVIGALFKNGQLGALVLKIAYVQEYPTMGLCPGGGIQPCIEVTDMRQVLYMDGFSRFFCT